MPHHSNFMPFTIAKLKQVIRTMDLSIVSTILLVIALVAILPSVHNLAKIFYDYKKRSCNYPPIAGTVVHMLINFRYLHDYLTQLAQVYPTFRLISPFHHRIFTVDPVIVEHILKSNFEKYGKGWFNYENMKDLLGDGIFAVDGAKWRHQRKLASFEFSTKVLRDYSGTVFKRNAAKLADIVSNSVKCNEKLEIQVLFMKSTMDSIFEVGFGVVLNSLNGSEHGSKFAKAFDDSNEQVGKRYANELWRIMKLLNVGTEARLKKNIKMIDDFIYNLIDKKVAEISAKGSHLEEKGDVLSRFLDERKNDPENMSNKYLRDILLNFVIAGKDTTAGALSWFFYLICKDPMVQEKIFQELKQVTKASRGSNVEEFLKSLTDDILNKLNFLHAALSETLRLYPAVPAEPKVCLSDDILPGGYNIKNGDIIFYLPYAMGRMKCLWGEDAESFKPERWLDDSGTYQPESPFKFSAFQAGPRLCLGKEFAYRQMKIFAAVLLFHFSFKLYKEDEVAQYRTMLTFHLDKGLQIRASCRP